MERNYKIDISPIFLFIVGLLLIINDILDSYVINLFIYLFFVVYMYILSCGIYVCITGRYTINTKISNRTIFNTFLVFNVLIIILLGYYKYYILCCLFTILYLFFNLCIWRIIKN